jgi:hypothetical protein
MHPHDRSHESPEPPAPGPIERAIADIRRRRALARQAENGAALEAMSPPVFRATVVERLRALERDVAEVRQRVNGLLFVVAGAAVTQIVLRLFA